jgi:threonine/homoserine/homoserine lactone efflux protein
MVAGWITVLLIMIGVSIYATLVYCDTSMWSDISNLVTIPLSCGGAIWMVKNSVQHAIANSRGEQAHMDFPKVNADGEADGNEEMVVTKNEAESEEVMG